MDENDEGLELHSLESDSTGDISISCVSVTGSEPSGSSSTTSSECFVPNTSLLDRLRAAKPSECGRKRKVSFNAPSGKKRSQGKIPQRV